jgi:exodeoxyribonuclease-3
VFRHFHPEMVDEYTWRSYRGGARDRNVWRRIDYVTVSLSLIEKVTDFRHRQDIVGSDHCPVEVILT